MSPKDALAVVWGVLILCLVQSDAQFYDTQAASLSKAPVGLYSRRGIFGDFESASSLGGAPVGLYGKRHFPRFPIVYPALYPSPLLFGLPQYGNFPTVSNAKRALLYPTSVSNNNRALLYPTSVSNKERALLYPTSVSSNERALLYPTSVSNNERALLYPTSVSNNERALLYPTSVSNNERALLYPTSKVSRPPSKSGSKQTGVSPRFLGGLGGGGFLPGLLGGLL